jgi:hydrogenase nickel incorporation protein HypA/HybF
VHELSVATELYRSCRREIDARGGGRLLSVTVAVGELSAVEPDLLRFGWEAVISDSADVNARIEIDWCAAAQQCPHCGAVPGRQPGTWLRLCPTCSLPLVVEGGRELDIVTLEYDAADVGQEVPA